MDPIDQEDLRIAGTVRERLLVQRQRILASGLEGTGCVIDRMQELLAIQRMIERARLPQQSALRRMSRTKWDEALRHLTCAIRKLAHRKDPMPPAAPAVSLLLQDLATIRREFGHFEWFPDTLILAVPTPPIVLQGVDLGRFRIDLKIRSLGRRSGKRAFRIHTMDLRSAASNGLVHHPHLLADYLNAREHTERIRQARHAGRLADFFHFVLQALQTYDAHKALVKLEDWDKVVCSQCRSELPEGLQTFCDTCQESCCETCRLACPQCHRRVCEACQAICPACGRILCDACITSCATCGSPSCAKCLQTGLCSACVVQWARQA